MKKPHKTYSSFKNLLHISMFLWKSQCDKLVTGKFRCIFRDGNRKHASDWYCTGMLSSSMDCFVSTLSFTLAVIILYKKALTPSFHFIIDFFYFQKCLKQYYSLWIIPWLMRILHCILICLSKHPWKLSLSIAELSIWLQVPFDWSFPQGRHNIVLYTFSILLALFLMFSRPYQVSFLVQIRNSKNNFIVIDRLTVP